MQIEILRRLYSEKISRNLAINSWVIPQLYVRKVGCFVRRWGPGEDSAVRAVLAEHLSLQQRTKDALELVLVGEYGAPGRGLGVGRSFSCF